MLHTDHKNLQKLFNTASDFRSGKLFRWAVRLQGYHFECRYVKGTDNKIADYLSRESVFIQTNEYAAIETFYSANNAYNKIRKFHSNNGGVDILKLYKKHLHISILLGSDPHYIANTDPYNILNENVQYKQHKNKICKSVCHRHALSPNKTCKSVCHRHTLVLNKKYKNKLCESICHRQVLSPQSHQFLNISTDNQLIMHKKKFDQQEKNLLDPNCVIEGSQDPHNKNYDNDIDDQYHQSANSYFKTVHAPIDVHNGGPFAIHASLPLKEHADQVVGADSPEEILEDLRFRLEDIETPEPYVPPTDRKHDRSKETTLRRSKRLATKRRKEQPVRQRHQTLSVSRRDPYKSKDLRRRDIYKRRCAERKRFKERNLQIIQHKPYEHVWNGNLLMPKYYIPILDDYGPIWDESHKVQKNLLKTKQWNDTFCFAIINFLDTGNKSLVLDLPKYIQRYILSGRFMLNDDKILCYRQRNKGGTETVLQVLPSTLISSVLKRTHSKMHHGANKMMFKILNNMKYWWPKMRHHMKVYCKCCNTCQHIKPGLAKRYRRGKMKLFVATKPFEQISVDIVGPLPTSQSGNRYIVSMIDTFTRYCMLVAVQDVTALSVVKAIDKWMTTFGPPKSILSDNGPQFISSLYQNYMDNHGGIKYKYTTTYHPQCNGQIERLHRWIK